MVGENDAISNTLPTLEDKSWQYGFVSYDYKNRIESLVSDNPDSFSLPDCCFKKPDLAFRNQGQGWKDLLPEKNPNGIRAEEILNNLFDEHGLEHQPVSIRMKTRFGKEEYIRTVQSIKKRILAGEVYEMNFCQEFYASGVEINPAQVFRHLQELSPAPFSAILRKDNIYLISSSPERFLRKEGTHLYSQPIKGTRRRGNNAAEDQRLKEELSADEKERAENVMIVDLVRNDLSRIAARGSVKVDELFGIYSFEQVHQMISTISCTLKPDTSFAEILRATFPMGSMTGAPKIRAMELIEKYERSRRGLYSGALGVITPQGDFDFSVVIRSILYDSEKKYVSITVGSAITHRSDPEKEYEECLLKAKGMLLALHATLE